MNKDFKNPKYVGYMKKSKDGSKHQSNSVYSPYGLAPTLCHGGDRLKTYTYILVKDND